MSLYFPLTILLSFILASALTVMNMLIGVLCEVVSAVASAEKEDGAIRIVKDRLLVLLKELDVDGSGLIDKEEMQTVLDNKEEMQTVQEIHVDTKFLLDQLDMMFEESNELTIHSI